MGAWILCVIATSIGIQINNKRLLGTPLRGKRGFCCLGGWRPAGVMLCLCQNDTLCVKKELTKKKSCEGEGKPLYVDGCTQP